MEYITDRKVDHYYLARIGNINSIGDEQYLIKIAFYQFYKIVGMHGFHPDKQQFSHGSILFLRADDKLK